MVSWCCLQRSPAAHPLGNFTINRYSRLEIESNQITVIYIVDRAEIPAFQEREAIDTNKDGQLSNDEQQAYLQAEIARVCPTSSSWLMAHPLRFSLNPTRSNSPPGKAAC